MRVVAKNSNFMLQFDDIGAHLCGLAQFGQLGGRKRWRSEQGLANTVSAIVFASLPSLHLISLLL